MPALDEYLSGSFHADGLVLGRVEDVIGEVVGTLTQSFDDQLGWPYKLEGEVDTPTGLSQSTTAMIAVSLYRAAGSARRKMSALRFPAPVLPKGSTALATANAAARLLATAITAAGAATASRTFGANDPFTLPFIAELAHEQGSKLADVRSFLETKAAEFRALPPEQSKLFFSEDKRPEVIQNAVIALKAVQLVRSLDERATLHSFRTYFEHTLHEHLSFSSIPDSRFDPAELTFTLEGLLLCQEHAVDPTLFQRVLDVLERAQEESAFWRPAKPFMAQEQGWALFPVSVEVANSLLRSCEIFDGDRLQESFGSASLNLFRRYWQWLRARTVHFERDAKTYVGWHSEHVNEAGIIHLWGTSQVLEFLIGYRRLIQSHIARTTLLLSQFSTAPPTKTPADWSKIQETYEAVTSLGENYQVYDRVGHEFIAQWRDGNPTNYSMLLYGPPGTGKTTVAESIADALNLRLITITVSDFLGAGGAEVEARAKAIFQVLQSQPACVVLFDEVDNFLLDRDSTRYSEQDTVFQFMTPGMLTKLNELRRAARLIFVVATNYENRIDSAIKRTGRVDEKYLVLPPDARSRRRILEVLVKQYAASISVSSEDEWTRISACSIFLGFKDMEGVVKRCASGSAQTVAELCEMLDAQARTTSLGYYRARFADPAEGCPYEEFLCLLALAVTEAPESKYVDAAAIGAVLDAIKRQESTLEATLDQHAGSLPNEAREKVLRVLHAHADSREVG